MEYGIYDFFLNYEAHQSSLFGGFFLREFALRAAMAMMPTQEKITRKEREEGDGVRMALFA